MRAFSLLLPASLVAVVFFVFILPPHSSMLCLVLQAFRQSGAAAWACDKPLRLDARDPAAARELPHEHPKPAPEVDGAVQHP